MVSGFKAINILGRTLRLIALQVMALRDIAK
jgi:hypothetical protein